jgi:hypothetical protein
MTAKVAVVLIELTLPTGKHHIEINPAEISSVRQPADVNGHWAKGTNCIIVMTNGRFNAVIETCETVLMKIGAAK